MPGKKIDGTRVVEELKVRVLAFEFIEREISFPCGVCMCLLIISMYVFISLPQKEHGVRKIFKLNGDIPLGDDNR